MRKVLNCGSQQYEILRGADPRPPHRILEFLSRAAALRFLQRFRRDYFNLRMMRQALNGSRRHRLIFRMDNHDVIFQLAGDLVAGRLIIVELTAEVSIPSPGSAGIPQKTAAMEAEPQAAPTKLATEELPEKDWIEIELLDESGLPVKFERCVVTDRDGNNFPGLTNDQGIFRIRELNRGNCKIVFPDWDREAIAQYVPPAAAAEVPKPEEVLLVEEEEAEEPEEVVIVEEEEVEEELAPALQITEVDDNFAPDSENLKITYTIKDLSAENVLLQITCAALGGAAIFEYALTDDEKADGENKILENWNGQCDRGPNALKDKFINPLFSPYKVKLVSNPVTSNEEEFAVLYDSIRMSPGRWIPPDDDPDYNTDVQPLLSTPVTRANEVDLTGKPKAIKWLQIQLNKQGYFAGTVDGNINSAELKKAIRRYNCANLNAGQANFDCEWDAAYSVKDSLLDDANHGINKVTEGLLESLNNQTHARVVLDPDVFNNTNGNPVKVEAKLLIEAHRFYVTNAEQSSENSKKKWETDRGWLSRPLFPVQVEVLILDKNGAGQVGGKAVGPVGVKWSWVDEKPDDSNLLAHAQTKTDDYLDKAHTAMRPDAPYPFDNLQEPAGGVLKGDDTDNSAPFVEQEKFPQFNDGDGYLFSKVFTEDGNNAGLLGTTCVGFLSSVIGGDNYKITAEIDLDDDSTYNWADVGNKNICNTANQAVQVKLTRSSGKIEIWRQIKIAAYLKWSTAPDRIPGPQWTNVAAEYKAAFIDLVVPGAPVALDNTLKGSLKAALKGTDGNIMLDGTDTISGSVLTPRVAAPDPTEAIHYAEKLKLYQTIEGLQNKYFIKFAEIVKAKYPDGVSLIDWSGHEKFNDAGGLNAFNNPAWTDYQSFSGSFGGPNGIAFVDHELLTLYAPYHLVAHEIGHTLFLEHWKNTAPIAAAHDQLDDNCIMSYLPLIHDFEVTLKMGTSNFAKADIKVRAINAIGSVLKFYDGDLTMTLQTTTAEPGWNDTKVVANRKKIYKFPNNAFKKRRDGDFLPAAGSLVITSPEGITKTITWQSADGGRADHIDKIWPAATDPVPPEDLGTAIARGNAAHYRPGVYLPHFCGKCNLKLRGWDISAGVLPADSS